MTEPLTIVLPMHNAERSLQRTVHDILELAGAAERELQIAIVDDGSTDDTYEIACELARAYPQVHVVRQPFQRGLGPALDRARREFQLTEAIVHDGVSRIDLSELARLLDTHAGEMRPEASRSDVRFGAVALLDARLQQAHRALTSFRWLRMEERVAPRRQAARPIAPLAQPPRGEETSTPAGR